MHDDHFGQEDAWKCFKYVKNFIFALLLSFAISIEVLLHTRFGRRYLAVPTCLLGLVMLALPGGMLAGLAGRFMGSSLDARWASSMAHLGLVGVFIAACFVQAFIAERNHRRRQWHSRSAGVPLIPWERTRLPRCDNAWFVSGVYEPALAVLAGLILLYPFNLGIGAVVVVAGFCLTFKTMIERSYYTENLDNIRDNQLMAKAMVDAVQARPQRDVRVNGFVVPEVDTWSPQMRATMADALSRLDPKLRSMVESKPVPGSDPGTSAGTSYAGAGIPSNPGRVAGVSAGNITSTVSVRASDGQVFPPGDTPKR